MNTVLFVTQTHNVWGGMEQWLHHFSRWLQLRGWRVRAALPRGRSFNDPVAYLEEHPHLDPIVMDVRDGSERMRVAALAGAIRQSEASIVIPIASGAIFSAMGEARRRGARSRLLVPIRSLHPDLFCNVADHASEIDQVVAISRLIEATISGMLPRDGRVAYVRHGVRPARRCRTPTPGRLRIGFVGRLEQATKRVLDLPALASALGRRRVPADLQIFGCGPDEKAVRRSVRGSDDAVPVRFHGTIGQDALYERAYPELDLLVLLSPAEGSPNAVYEAMQHGVVPVVSRFLGQGPERIVRHGETGIVFPVGDMEAAANEIASLAEDRERLERLSQSARHEVEKDTNERMHRDWESILEAMLERAPKPADPALRRPAAGESRLDALLPAAAIAGLRRLLGRSFPHPDGWGEWPGTAPASPRCIEAVRRRIVELDGTLGEGDGR